MFVQFFLRYYHYLTKSHNFCSIGNFFFAGARIFFQSLDAAIFLFSRVSDIPSESMVLPVISTNDRLTLGCELWVWWLLIHILICMGMPYVLIFCNCVLVHHLHVYLLVYTRRLIVSSSIEDKVLICRYLAPSYLTYKRWTSMVIESCKLSSFLFLEKILFLVYCEEWVYIPCFRFTLKVFTVSMCILGLWYVLLSLYCMCNWYMVHFHLLCFLLAEFCFWCICNLWQEDPNSIQSDWLRIS